MYKRIYEATILAKFLSKVLYSIKNNKSMIAFFPKCDILKRVRKCINLNIQRKETL